MNSNFRTWRVLSILIECVNSCTPQITEFYFQVQTCYGNYNILDINSYLYGKHHICEDYQHNFISWN